MFAVIADCKAEANMRKLSVSAAALSCRRYLSDLLGRSSGDKKPVKSQIAEPERKHSQASELSTPASPADWETTQTKEDAKHPTDAAVDRPVSRVGLSLYLRGELSSNEDLYLDGMVEGRVQLNDRKLTIATTAKVAADIFAGEVVVCGTVKGDVHAKKRIEIKKEGSVTGDLTTPEILIEDGAYFKGTIEIELSADQEANKNVSPKTESEPDAPLTGRKVA
jgi:cytoskeletal protein CcmA (bactofilin family)